MLTSSHHMHHPLSQLFAKGYSHNQQHRHSSHKPPGLSLASLVRCCVDWEVTCQHAMQGSELVVLFGTMGVVGDPETRPVMSLSYTQLRKMDGLTGHALPTATVPSVLSRQWLDRNVEHPKSYLYTLLSSQPLSILTKVCSSCLQCFQYTMTRVRLKI
jgi:hypothetical protein